MKRKHKINPDNVYVGMRYKTLFGGWWFGLKHNIWVRCKIIKFSKNKDNKIQSIVFKAYNKKYGQLGTFFASGDQCETLYKLK